MRKLIHCRYDYLDVAMMPTSIRLYCLYYCMKILFINRIHTPSQ